MNKNSSIIPILNMFLCEGLIESHIQNFRKNCSRVLSTFAHTALKLLTNPGKNCTVYFWVNSPSHLLNQIETYPLNPGFCSLLIVVILSSHTFHLFGVDEWWVCELYISWVCSVAQVAQFFGRNNDYSTVFKYSPPFQLVRDMIALHRL